MVEVLPLLVIWISRWPGGVALALCDALAPMTKADESASPKDESATKIWRQSRRWRLAPVRRATKRVGSWFSGNMGKLPTTSKGTSERAVKRPRVPLFLRATPPCRGLGDAGDRFASVVDLAGHDKTCSFCKLTPP